MDLGIAQLSMTAQEMSRHRISKERGPRSREPEFRLLAPCSILPTIVRIVHSQRRDH
jgi:hypothetical protein